MLRQGSCRHKNLKCLCRAHMQAEKCQLVAIEKGDGSDLMHPPPYLGEQRRDCLCNSGWGFGERFSQQGTPKVRRASFTGVRTEQSVHSICSFSCCYDKIPSKSYLRMEWFILAHDSRA